MLLFFSSIYSQNGVALKIEYNESITYTPKIINKRISKLYVSKNFSYYKAESLKANKKSNDEDSETIVVDDTNDDTTSEIIVNFKEKKLIERLYENLFLKKYYSVSEKMPEMKWTMVAGKKKINNYDCKKAQTTFRGRTYTVWYTEKIPISIGPWKFSGLPGLILSAEDNEGIYKWVAKTIVYPYKSKDFNLENAIKENSKYKNITFKDFDEKRIEVINDKIKKIRARSSSRDGIKVGFSYSTYQEREPINEYRTKTNFN